MEDHTLRDTVEDMQPGRTQEEDGAYSFSAGSGQEKTGIEGQSMSGMDPGQEKSSAEKGAEAEKNDRREAGKSAFVEELISWIYSFIVMFIVALFLTQFVIINAVIPSGSMEDTIMTHDRLIGARFSYWFSEPERGDIVIFHYPVEEKKIYIVGVGICHLNVVPRGNGNHLDDFHISWDAMSQFSAESGCFPSMQLDELELKWFYLFHYLINGCIDKNSHSLALLRKIIGHIFHEAWRFLKKDKPHPIGTRCFNGANVFGFAHTTHFDNHIPLMNSLRASPGLGVFINVSPMRKPRKPAWRSSLTVSGLLMPLSETRR